MCSICASGMSWLGCSRLYSTTQFSTSWIFSINLVMGGKRHNQINYRRLVAARFHPKSTFLPRCVDPTRWLQCSWHSFRVLVMYTSNIYRHVLFAIYFPFFFCSKQLCEVWWTAQANSDPVEQRETIAFITLSMNYVNVETHTQKNVFLNWTF